MKIMWIGDFNISPPHFSTKKFGRLKIISYLCNMIKDDINREISAMFSDWDMSEIAELTEAIGEEVADDVMETSDYPNYNSSDIRIAIKRVIIENCQSV